MVWNRNHLVADTKSLFKHNGQPKTTLCSHLRNCAFYLWGYSWDQVIQILGRNNKCNGESNNPSITGSFCQFFGQSSFSFMNIVLGIDIPYPGIPDIGFFGTIPFYILGSLLIAKASGVRVGLKSFTSKIQAIAIPTIMVLIVYFLYLTEYEFAETSILTIFLDFGYPVGQAINVSIALLTYSLSRKILGGLMKGRILLLVAAFATQFIADFNFLYQNIAGTWINGGYGDLLYQTAYLVMVLGLFQLRAVAIKLNKK